MKLDEIRTRFLEYFKKNGHQVVRSSSLIPEGDPTLLFTNAGMNQFKDVFLGLEKRSYSRASTSQKCFRVSGKHNDLENVGRTSRHHTFFEMLGNFSFGDYFKREAIAFAWEFMTKEMALPKDKLWITVYLDDDDAFNLWREVAGVSADRILRMDEKDNFWSMGDTGPCGPCSEIHIDQGPEVGCGRQNCGIECECDRYLELWNLVFMQYNRDASGNLNPLPRPSIDTGMGIERIAAVMQGVHSNYDTDLFQDIIGRIADLAGVGYGEDRQKDVSLRVIADHARAMSFLIADGILPANEGRGYVLRRVMRRAGRHVKMLGKDEPVLYQAADKVADLMGDAYPELVEKRSFIKEVIRNEEERFLETLGSGLRILEDEIGRLSAGKPIPGEVAFKLYDTYGFPLDLTQTIAEEHNLAVDAVGFEKAMAEQRERAREHWKGSGEAVVDAAYKEIRTRHGETEFIGYETTEGQARALALVKETELVKEASGPGTIFHLITDRTPFYGEAGGQVGDTGAVFGGDFEAEVTDTKRPLEGLFVHHCRIVRGAVREGQPLTMRVESKRRADIARNHTATHLLQAALQKIVGSHVHQKGSLVTPDRFRFDLTHFSQVTPDELRKIENLVNQWVRENQRVTVRHLARSEAVKLGAMALFGEKYGETVRMVETGDISRELCGGTHTGRTGDVGLFKVMGESSVAAGVRRIEAVTGRAAVDWMHLVEDRLSRVAESLKVSPEELEDRVVRLQEEVKVLKRGIKTEKERKLADSGDPMSAMVEMGGVKVLAVEVEVEDPKELRPLGDRLKDRLKSGVAVIGARAKGKAHLLVVVTEDLTGRVKAGDIVKEIAPLVGGKGGGRPDFAQAGGPDQEKVGEALARAREVLAKSLGG